MFKLKEKLKKEENKRLLSNFISLSILQGTNYILPLITFPYLVRVLGVEKFGLLAFASATIAYFNILTDYGFNLTATREVSIYRDDKEKLIEIFNSVMMIKFLLMILSLILLTILIFSFSKFKEDYVVYYLTFGMVIGQVLFPQWFFQGMERMKYITFLNITAKVIFTIAIFAFIHKESDYWKVPLLNSLGFIIAGIIALYIILKDFKMEFRVQKLSTIIWYLKDGWYIFISSISGSIYRTSTTVILGIFTTHTVVGYYSIAEKIIGVFKSMLNPILQTFYPYVSKKLKENFKEGIFIIRKIFFILVFFTFLIGSLIIYFSENIVYIVTNNKYLESIILLKIMAFIPTLIVANIIFGTFLMLNLGMKREYSITILKGGIISLFLSFIFIPILQDIGASIVLVSVELYIVIKFFLYVNKKLFQ